MSRRDRVNDAQLTPAERLQALRELVKAGQVRRESALSGGEVNNHVHTIYSFSPYTPSMAVLKAFEAGLDAVGSVDHDSVGAARETLEAGKVLGIATTVGCEVRVSFAKTPFEHRKINYPECLGKAYMVFHGLPERSLDAVEAFLKPLREVRVERTRAMTIRLSEVFVSAGLPSVHFERDVASITQLHQGGGVTERHLCAAAAKVLRGHAGNGKGVVTLLQDNLGFTVTPEVAKRLGDEANPHALYDLVGFLKTTLLEQVFLQPSDLECPPVREVVAFARSVGALPSYAYLGDVGESPTGDKKAEFFEDAYLAELLAALGELGFQAVTYMPPRNSLAQLKRVQELCASHGLMEISGVDINSSRQSFHCPEVLLPEFRHLNQSTWALIAHEKLTNREARLGLFDPRNPGSRLPLTQRLEAYAQVGRAMDAHHPQNLGNPEFAIQPAGSAAGSIHA